MGISPKKVPKCSTNTLPNFIYKMGNAKKTTTTPSKRTQMWKTDNPSVDKYMEQCKLSYAAGRV